MSFNDDESIVGIEIQEVSAGDEREGKKFAATRLSIKEARVMADDTQLETAKDIIVRIQSSLDYEEFNLPEDEVDKHNEMRSDLKRLLKLMRTEETYEKEGRAFALSLETSLDPHHLAARGNEGLPAGTGKTKMRIISKREAPLEQSKFNVMLELTSNETPGLDLVTVLDISGSMRGEKLKKMKSAMQLVIKKLSPIDRLSVVTFSSHSNTLCPLRYMTENSKAEIKMKVNALAADGGTNISDGLEMGLRVLKEGCLTSRRWVAIMLLCDGEQGPRERDAAEVEIGNVPLYTFGLGSYYDPKMLKAIAYKSSGGMFTDVQNVDKLREAFSQCLDGLLRLVVKDLKVTITQKNNTKIEKVSVENYSPYKNHDGSVTLSLDDLYEKELHKVVVELYLPAVSSTKCDDILEISYAYSFCGEVINTKPQFVTITRRNSTPPPMINGRVMTERQQNVANKKIIEAQKLLKNVVDETLKSEVQQLKRLMNSQKIYDQQDSEEITIDDSRLQTAKTEEGTTSLAPFGHSNNEVEINHPIEFLLDRIQIRKTIPKSLKWSEYQDWSEKVKTYLETLKVWKVIEPEELPIETTGSVENDGKNSLATRKAIEELRQFRENWMAVIVINEACGIPIKLQIIDLDSAKTAWETLATNSKQGVDVWKFLIAAEHGDWKIVESLLNTNHDLARELLTARIPSSQNTTVLHLASLAGEVDIVETLVALIMKEENLEIEDNDGYTALAKASINGNTRIAKCMVEKNKKLASIPTGTKLLPVVIAMMYGNKEMAMYLYSETLSKDLTSKGNINGATLLTYSIKMQLYDISFDLIKKCPHLAAALDHNGQSALYQLACAPSAFLSSSQLNFYQKWMYNRVRVPEITWDNNHVNASVEGEEDSQSNVRNAGNQGIWQRIVSRLHAVLGIKHIYEKKLLHHLSVELVSHICEDMDSDDQVNGIIDALHEGVAKGVVELIVGVLKQLPELRRSRDKEGSTLFMKAVEFRQPEVFSLLQEFASKDKMIDWVDDHEENVLHKLKYDFLDQISSIQGAVLKMQTEVQWFEKIKPMMLRDSLKQQNRDGKTAQQLFTESHKKLMIGAEKWMKETANSCIVVGILVVTIMFAAGFTVPGGNDQHTGLPIFLKKKLFKIFIISDAVSLFSSTTSVLMFLGILSSRYTEKDFLKSLPIKMIIGLFSLFVSIAAMMIAFAATLFIMLRAESRIILPVIISLAAFPVMLYVLMLFPLLYECFMSTFGPSIFVRKR